MRHGGSVAAGSVHHCDIALAAIISIDMVGAYCGRGDEFHFRLFERLARTDITRADNHAVGLAQQRGSHFLRFEILYRGIRVEQPLYIGYVLVGDSLIKLFGMQIWRRMPQEE